MSRTFTKVTFSGKSAVFALLVVTAALFSESCLSLLMKGTQSVSFTSRPSGARVYVDGALMGEAPLKLKLDKGSPHAVRFEKDGYRPVEIKIKSRIMWGPILGLNIFWGAPMLFLAFFTGFDQPDKTLSTVSNILLVGVVAVPIAGMVSDAASSAGRQLSSPTSTSITLKKDQGNGSPLVLEMEAEEFRKITWIRIQCGSDKS